jgi:hypothetical protein
VSEKTMAARLRRVAARQGLMLVKSRTGPQSAAHGLYVLVNDSRGNRVGRYGGQAAVSAFYRGHGLSLEAVASELGVNV